eukprot:536610_1
MSFSLAIWVLCWIACSFSVAEIIKDNGFNVTVSIHDDEIIIKKQQLIHQTSFTELFATGCIQHEFINNNKAKQTLIKHENTLNIDVYEQEQITYIKYYSEYFEIVIKIPNHLFEVDLENCSETEQLKFFKDKYEEHIRILTLNNYQIDTIKMNQMQDNDFVFKIYQPDEIIYDHKGFTPPKQTGSNQQRHQITKDEYQLNMLQTFYKSIMSKYGIKSTKIDNYELNIASFLSQNKINITQNKYYKNIGQEIYYIKDNETPNIIFNIFNDKITIANLDMLYLKLNWIKCPTHITNYFIELIEALTMDHIVTKLPTRQYFVDKRYESDVFIINIKGRTSTEQTQYNSRTRRNEAVPVQSSFVVSLLYKLVIKNAALLIEYVGAMQYYDTTFKKYDITENIAISFDTTSKNQNIHKITKYQMLVSEVMTIYEYSKKDKDYSFTVTPQFPVRNITLQKITFQ